MSATPRYSCEIKRRIMISVWAYAYEMLDVPLVSDAVYDSEASYIDEDADTGNPVMDKWFSENYDEFTGSWIRRHPQLDRIKYIHGVIIKSKGPDL